MPKNKLTYDDIKLNGKVKLPAGYQRLGNAQIVGIDNVASLVGIDEPVFTCVASDLRFHFGLKYVLKMYVPE